jgi:hypothetical protein
MVPAGSGIGSQGPDHPSFELADASKRSLSFYGKRPGPGMRLDKPSLHFATRLPFERAWHARRTLFSAARTSSAVPAPT